MPILVRLVKVTLTLTLNVQNTPFLDLDNNNTYCKYGILLRDTAIRYWSIIQKGG